MFLSALRLSALIGALGLTLAGCGSHPEKTDVAPTPVRAGLAFDGYPVDASFNEELYCSKEAASGGRTFGSGGKGCN